MSNRLGRAASRKATSSGDFSTDEYRQSALRAPSPQVGMLRRGALLVEMVVCTVLLSLVATILVPAVHAIQKQRKAARCETLTLIELNNQAALLRQSNGEDSEHSALSDWFAKRYPGTDLTLTPVAEGSVDEGSSAAVKIAIRHPVDETGFGFNRSLTVWVNVPKAVQ